MRDRNASSPRRGMFRRGSQRVSHRTRVLTVVLTVCVLLFATAAAAFADIVPPGGVTFTNKTENCNGIIPTPGSENTVKTLTRGSLAPGGDLVPGATFVIWNCDNSADDPTLQPIVVTPAPSSGDIYSNTLAGGAVVHATGGFVAVSGPSGSTCNVTETVPPPGFQLPDTVTHSFTIPVGTTGATIINFVDPLAPGSIKIEKTAPAGAQSTVFHFTITCTNPSNVYHVQITGTGAVTQSDVPAGSSCTVTEDDPGSTFNPPVIAPSGAFTVASNQTVTVTVTNSFAPGSITIEKTAPAGSQSTVFHFTITCTNPSNVYHVQVTGSGSV